MIRFTIHPIVFFVCVMAVWACDPASGPEDYVTETYAHTRPAWSPDGLTIAFRNQIPGEAGIYLIDSSGANLRLLHPGEGIGLSWSPDSRWIAFSAVGSLYKIRATGDSLTQITTGPGHIRPAWSPDGDMIAFQRSGIRLLTLSTGQTKALLTRGIGPTWTPAGDILFMSTASGVLPVYYTFETVDTAATETQVLHGFTSSYLCEFSSMNSAGEDIVFSAKATSGQVWTRIVKISLGPMTRKDLTSDGGDYPAWSPDGSMIVYMRTAEGDGGLWIMNADGSNKRMLTQP